MSGCISLISNSCLQQPGVVLTGLHSHRGTCSHGLGILAVHIKEYLQRTGLPHGHAFTQMHVHQLMCAAFCARTASYVVNGHTGTMLVCWRSTAVPRRAARSCNLRTSSQSLCPCSSRPSSPSTWPSTGACLSTMAPASSWPWLSASSLVLSSGAWETNCKLSTHHAVCVHVLFVSCMSLCLSLSASQSLCPCHRC